MMHSETGLLQTKTVDRFNQEKLYIQLTRIFLEEITRGNWQLNKKIPSEDELCKKYRVSKITVRQAINNLVSDGYLMKIQGKGTFVTSAKSVVGLAMKTRFTENMFGKEVDTERHIITKGLIDPPVDIREFLKTDRSVYFILIRRMINNYPVYLDESYIPYALLPDVSDLDLTNISLYAVLQEKALKKIFKVIQTIEVSLTTAESAKHLELEEGIPILAVHRLLLSSDNTPVGYTRFLGRSDRYKFQTEFERIR